MKNQKLLLVGIVVILFAVVIILYKNNSPQNSSTNSEETSNTAQLSLTTNEKLKNIDMTVPGTCVQATLENGQAEVDNDGVNLSVRILDNYKEIADSTGKYILSPVAVKFESDVNAFYLMLFQDQNGVYKDISNTLVGDIDEIKELTVETTGSQIEHLVILTYTTKASENTSSVELVQKFMISNNKIEPIQ